MTTDTPAHDLRSALEPDMSWFDIAVTHKREVVILGHSDGWREYDIEHWWEDTFEIDAPSHLEPGAYRWTDFHVGYWDEDDAINVSGGQFTALASDTDPCIISWGSSLSQGFSEASDTIGNGGGEVVAWLYKRQAADGPEVIVRPLDDRWVMWKEDRDLGWTETPLFAHPPAAEPVGLREALQLAHDTLHECTAVLTASDCAKVSAAMAVCRKALATPARTDDAAQAGGDTGLKEPVRPYRNVVAETLVKSAQPEIDSIGSHAGNGGDFDPYAQAGGAKVQIIGGPCDHKWEAMTMTGHMVCTNCPETRPMTALEAAQWKK